MSVEKVIKCDVCGAVRGEGNRWFSMVNTLGESPCLLDFYENSPQHICSETCAHKALSDWLAEARKRQA